MSKAITVTLSISTDTRITGRYFVDVRDTTAGRNRQMTTRVLDDVAPFLAELAKHADAAGVAMTVVDETGGELADSAAVAESAAAIAAAPAAPVADDLDGKLFPELMAIAKLHNVPGRGTARKGQLIAGIRAARGQADAAFRRALSAPGAVVTPQPVTAPAVLPGNAAAALVWSGRRELTGRYRIETIKSGSRTLYRGVVVNGGDPVGAFMARLRDAKHSVQTYHEMLHRAHNTAAAMDRAREMGVAEWAQLDSLRIEATVEDDRRTRLAARPRKALSPLGELAASFRETHPVIAR